MSEPTSATKNLPILPDNSEAVVTHGTKTLPRDTRVTVIGHDAVTGNYAVRTPDGRILTAKDDRVGPAPEKTFTASEVLSALREAYANSGDAYRVAQNLGLGEDLEPAA